MAIPYFRGNKEEKRRKRSNSIELEVKPKIYHRMGDTGSTSTGSVKYCMKLCVSCVMSGITISLRIHNIVLGFLRILYY